MRRDEKGRLSKGVHGVQVKKKMKIWNRGVYEGNAPGEIEKMCLKR